MYKHILIATDDSEVGRRGVDHAIRLAGALGAHATIITVTEPFPFYSGDAMGYAPTEATLVAYQGGLQDLATEILDNARLIAEKAGVHVNTLHRADAQPAEAILEAAKSLGCDLIVMGSHGRRGIGRLVLGSKTSEVIANAEVPVLVVR